MTVDAKSSTAEHASKSLGDYGHKDRWRKQRAVQFIYKKACFWLDLECNAPEIGHFVALQKNKKMFQTPSAVLRVRERWNPSAPPTASSVEFWTIPRAYWHILPSERTQSARRACELWKSYDDHLP